jgi:hypothetical protein
VFEKLRRDSTCVREETLQGVQESKESFEDSRKEIEAQED